MGRISASSSTRLIWGERGSGAQHLRTSLSWPPARPPRPRPWRAPQTCACGPCPRVALPPEAKPSTSHRSQRWKWTEEAGPHTPVSFLQGALGGPPEWHGGQGRGRRTRHRRDVKSGVECPSPQVWITAEPHETPDCSRNGHVSESRQRDSGSIRVVGHVEPITAQTARGPPRPVPRLRKARPVPMLVLGN